MASSREDWQAIGKRLEGRSNSSQTIVKQWSNGRRDQGAGAENCGVGNAAENSRTENHVRWRICSLRIPENLPEDPSGGERRSFKSSSPSASIGNDGGGRFLRFYTRSAIAQLPLQLCYCRPENLPPSSFWHDLHLVVPVCPRAGIHRLRFWVFSHLKSKQWTPAQLHTGATRRGDIAKPRNN